MEMNPKGITGSKYQIKFFPGERAPNSIKKPSGITVFFRSFLAEKYRVRIDAEKEIGQVNGLYTSSRLRPVSGLLVVIKTLVG
jgi:hypothetical protein